MWKRVVLAFGVVLVCMVVAAAATLWFAVGGFTGTTKGLILRGGNMEPALSRGQRVVCSDGWSPRVGDMVAFKDPAGRRPSQIGRVVATGGQTVDISNGQLTVNGVPVAEPYASGVTEPVDLELPVYVPNSTYWVMGDVRTKSLDSRIVGPIPTSSIIGTIRLRYWPLSRIAWF